MIEEVRTLDAVTRTISIRGLPIYHRVIRPERPVRHRVLMLCAPGFPTSSWRLIWPELLRAGCLCVICEMPGFGQNVMRGDIPVEPALRAKYLWGVLDEIDLCEADARLNRWHLMAHGSSAPAAIQMFKF